MAIDFPNAPATNATYTVGNKTWIYDGTTWNTYNSTTFSAETLPGTTIKSTVTGSSLTSVGTLGSLAVTGTATAGTFSGSGASLTSIPNSATTATSANTISTIVARDSSGNFTATTITAALTGTASGNLVSGGALGTPSSGTLTNCTSIPAGNLTGTVASARLPSVNIGTTSVDLTRASGALTLAGITLTSPTFTSPVLGTPSSGTLTNCTFPTLNQNTTGSAATLTTARTLWGQSFNGSAAISGSLTGVYDINTAGSPINTIYASNWFRSTGTSGWYNETHGGGMYMQDTTFVRIYNSKIFYAAGGIWSVDGGTASTSGFQYLLRGTLYGNYAPFTSMREVKRNIQTINNSGDLIDQLNPVTFQEKITESDDEVSIAWKNSDLEYGFIADEVALVGTGHLAQYQGMEDGTLKPVGWSFHGVISVLVAEAKDLRKRLELLENK
jgi:hypothetical protein